MENFVASAEIALADADAVIAAVCAHLTEHGVEVEEQGDRRVLRFQTSRARISRHGNRTHIEVSAPTLEDIYFIRMAIASHILEFAGSQVPEIEWTGDGRQLSRPPNFQILELVNAADVTPRMRRLTLKGGNLGRFARMDALHLNILVQHPDLAEPQWPQVGRNGLIEWQDPQRRPLYRKYTVRSLDLTTGVLDIDFVIHADAGPGSALAERARIGDRIGVSGPGGGGLAEANWYLFAGDETAVPAIARMLEHLPETARGKAFIEVADENEIQPLKAPAGIELEWLCRNGAQAGTTSLLPDAVEGTSFPQVGVSVYAWVGCEYDAFRRIRSLLRNERRLMKHQHLAVAYWRRGSHEAEL